MSGSRYLLALGLTLSLACRLDGPTSPSAPGSRSPISLATAGPTLVTAFVTGPELRSVTASGSTSIATVSGLGVGVSPDGSTAYVLLGQYPQRVRAYGVATGAVTAEASLAPNQFSNIVPGLALTPDGRHVLVAQMAPSFPNEADLLVLDAATLQPVMVIPGIGYNPHPIAVSPDGRYAYVGDRASNGYITGVDLGTGDVIGRDSLLGGGTEGPNSIAVTSDGTHLYVTQMNANQVLKLDAATVHITDSYPTCTVFGCVGVGPMAIALSPDETLLYIGYRSGVVEIRRTSDFGLVRTIALLGPPAGVDGIRVSRDGRVYVTAANASTVWILSGAGDIQASIPVPFPYAIALLETTPGATPIGTDISVAPVDQTTGAPSPFTVTFSLVTDAGTTQVTSASTGSPPPAGFRLGTPPVYYELTTTATYSAPITVCFTYDPAAFSNPTNIKLFHGSGGVWTDVTTSIDQSNHVVCGTTASLSPFIVAELHYDFTGFFQPVDNGNVLNQTKAGTSIPVKFSLGGDLGMDVLASASPTTAVVSCGSIPTIDPIEEATTSASGLHYDNGQYVYVWKTLAGWKGSCRKFMLNLRDGTQRVAIFQFK